MKAKLIKQWGWDNTIVPIGTEVAIIKGMEADAADVFNTPYGMCYLCEFEGSTHYIPATHLAITDWSNIDWQQRRYELAKEYSKVFISLQHEAGRVDCGCYVPDVVKWSVEFADALISELQKPK